jgi:hypothetical protein
MVVPKWIVAGPDVSGLVIKGHQFWHGEGHYRPLGEGIVV